MNLKLNRITFSVHKRDIKLVKVFDLVRKSENETNFAITLRKVANSHDLYRTEKRHKPCMIVPWTLIFGIRKISVFQFIEVFLNDG